MGDVCLTVKTRLPTAYGDFTLVGFNGFVDGLEHVALVRGDVAGQQNVLTRVHSECLTGEVFASRRCDCGNQLNVALEKIVAENLGVLIYLRQEGRGIGLLNKMRAYELQDGGMDTVEANHALGFANDLRDFGIAAEILSALGVPSVRLMTNNPEKGEALIDAGIDVTRVPLLMTVNSDNAGYLKTKAVKLGHVIPEEMFSAEQKNRA